MISIFIGLTHRKTQGWEKAYMEGLANDDEDNTCQGQIIFHISLIFSKPLAIGLALVFKKVKLPYKCISLCLHEKYALAYT